MPELSTIITYYSLLNDKYQYEIYTNPTTARQRYDWLVEYGQAENEVRDVESNLIPSEDLVEGSYGFELDEMDCRYWIMSKFSGR